MLMLATELKQQLCTRVVKLSELAKYVEAITTREDEKLDEAFVESVRRLGVVMPIVMKDGKIVEGKRVLRALLAIYDNPAKQAMVEVPVVDLCGVDQPPEFLRLISQLYSKPIKKPEECKLEILHKTTMAPHEDVYVYKICPICEAIFTVYNMIEEKDVLRGFYNKCLDVYRTLIATVGDRNVINQNLNRLAARGIKVPEIEEMVKQREVRDKLVERTLPTVEVKVDKTVVKMEVEKEEEEEEDELSERLKAKFAAVIRDVEKNIDKYERAINARGRLFKELNDSGFPKQISMYILDKFGSEVAEELAWLSKSVDREKLLDYVLPADKSVKIEISAVAYSKLKDLVEMYKIPSIYIVSRLINKFYELATGSDTDFDTLVDSLKV